FSASRSGHAPRTRRCKAASAVPPMLQQLPFSFSRRHEYGIREGESAHLEHDQRRHTTRCQEREIMCSGPQGSRNPPAPCPSAAALPPGIILVERGQTPKRV